MFRGLDIIKATINNHDITERIKHYYGVNNDWQNRVWKNKEIFGDNSLKSNYYIEFKSSKNVKYWFNGFVNNLDEYFYAPNYKEEIIEEINNSLSNLNFN